VECLLDLTTCDDRPDDPRRLVRHGDGSHPDGLSREQVGEARVHSLAPEVRALLAGITKVEKSDLVFTTTGKTPVSGFTKAKARLDGDVQELRAKAAAEVGKSAPEAIPGWRLHDFRRTAVTWMASNGIAPHVADRLLNHIQGTISGVAAIYQPGEFLAERKAALGAWAGWVTKT
jgi:integrase